jgi:predicted secreted protein
MAEPINIQGNDLTLILDGIDIGCADTIDFTITTATTSAVCRADGGWAQTVPGQHSWTASTGGLIRLATGADAADNKTYTDLRKLQIARTLVTLKFGTDISGDEVATGQAIITSTKATSPANAAATFTVDFQGTGPLTFSTNA